MDGGSGADRIFGGDGVDGVSYANSAAGVTAALGGVACSGGDAQGDVLSNIEGLIGSNFNDRLTGSAFGNRLEGGGGNDTLIGGGGGDQLFGGAGTDRADYTSSGSAVTVALGGPAGSGGDAAGDTLYFIENLTGSAFNDRLTGTAFGNRIEGGSGNDTLTGGAGPDQLFGGNGSDAADYSGSAAGVRRSWAARPAWAAMRRATPSTS